MVLTKESIGENLRRIDFQPEPEVFYNPIVVGVVKEREYRDFIKAQHDLWRRLQNTISDIEMNFRDLTDRFNEVEISAPVMAMQFMQVTADMLESSDDPTGTPVPRSVLTTASQTSTEFNWLLAGISTHASIAMGPGNGVAAHYIIVDLDDRNNPIQRKKASAGNIVDIKSSVFRPYGMVGTKVQLCSIEAVGDVLKVYPKSIAVGTYIQAIQILPPFKY